MRDQTPLDPLVPHDASADAVRDPRVGAGEDGFCEQLRIPMRAMQWAIYPGLLLLVVVFLAMRSLCPGNPWPLGLWCATAATIWIAIALHGRLRMGRAGEASQSRRLLRESKLLYALEGAVWGLLPWIVLGQCSIVGDALVVIVGAGVAASRMMLLVSLPSVFDLYMVVGGVVWIARAWDFREMPFHALAFVGLLYVLTLLFQARVYSRTLIETIRLRFANKALADELQGEIMAVEDARRRAEEANTAKTQFLAAASHDLRQPAQAQGLLLEVLSRTPLDDRQREILGHLRSTFNTSLEMLNTLLDFSCIEAGGLTTQRSDFPMQPLLDEIAIECAPQAQAKNLRHRFRPTDLVVHSDPNHVARILRNLVSNAIRYTETGGLLVTCRRRGGQAFVEVWDTGIGIAPEHHKEIFQEFQQLGNPERDHHKGLGLGLAIVKELTRLLGHELAICSRPGQGSRFRLVLPLGRDPHATSLPRPNSTPAARGARVLVVDDNAAIRVAMGRLLVTWGYHCDVADSLEEALACAEEAAPDVLISDYRLRGQTTGADVIRAIRALLGSPLPALLMTGDTDPTRIREARSTGITLLHKPIAPKELRTHLDAVLKAASGAQNRS